MFMPQHRIELQNSNHAIPPSAKAVRRTDPNQWIDVTLGVRRKADLPDLSNLETLPPRERAYMTHDQLARDYGSDPASIDHIQAFAAAHGLTVVREEPISARMTLGGPVSAMSEAFGVTLFDYADPKLGDFHARTGRVSLPTDVASDITGVFGFSNQRHLRRKRHGVISETAAAGATAARAWFLPTELAPIYNFPAGDAAGQTIALLEFGGGVEDADVSAYFAKIKSPRPEVTVVALDGVGVDPAADPDSTGEVMLDVDVAGALAPGAKLVVYFSTFDEKGLIDAVSALVSDAVNKPSVASISWGWDENEPMQNQVIWSPAAIDHVNHSLLAAAHLGVTVCVSTGDDGSEAQIKDGRAHVNFPATSPFVLAVGGTSLRRRRTSKGSSVIHETVWNDGPGSGTGGGVSDYTPVPAWQSGIVPGSINPGHFAGRAIPDVAANADPATGYLTMSGGKFGIVGGTSASAPLWAALIARINAALGAKTGNFNVLLYSKYGPADVLRDITLGDNDTDGLLGGQFAAGPGWDACTGWGVPDGVKLLTVLKS
jgi:kumamolisin